MDVPKQRAVVRADGAGHVVRQQVIHGMAAYPGREAEDLVGDGADLDADVALLHLGHDIGVPRQGKPVADALGSEEEGVHQVSVGVGADVEGLTAVEEKRDLYLRSLTERLESQELLSEGFQRLGFAFLAD
jgi:hypothetical protein